MSKRIAITYLDKMIWRAINFDGWEFWCVWGPKGTGKTSLTLGLAFRYYKNWDKVFSNLVFTSGQLAHKLLPREEIDNPNYRVPLIVWDDPAVHMSKYAFQDVFATEFMEFFVGIRARLGVLLVSAPLPTQLLKGIREDYTATIFLNKRGFYQFQRHIWQDNYYRNKPRFRKIYVQGGRFPKLPDPIYEKYKILRHQNLLERKFKQMQITEIERVTERLNELDKDLLKIMYEKHNLNLRQFQKGRKLVEFRGAKNKLIAFGLLNIENGVVSITQFGEDVYFSLVKPSVSSPSLSLELKPQTATPLLNINFKKQLAETLKFQGLRVTESYEGNEPDLVVWKDETTPSEIIAVRTLSVFPATIMVSKECEKEINFAKKFGIQKIRLICFDGLKRERVSDTLVGFNDVFTVEGKAEAFPESLPSQPEFSERQQISGADKKNRLIVNKKFLTTPIQISQRVVAVSDAFGVGVDQEKEFTVFKNLDFRYDDGDLIYVTGDSGAGKSTFLRIFQDYEKQRGRTVASFEEVSPSPDEVVINSVGMNPDEAMRILGIVGLSEAFLMLRRYKELSEGQKYRYKLAKLVDMKADTYIIDEFGATLDREMAKVLAFCIQKWARRAKKTLVIATTHKDLIEDFNPNIVLDRKFGEETKPIYYQPQKPHVFSLMKYMKIEKATKEDYAKLKRFHYMHGMPAGLKNRYKISYKGETVGVILYTVSFFNHAIRNKLFPEYKNNIQKVNAEIQRISRIVVHPKFRGVGLAQHLVRATLPLTGCRLVETVAVMAKYNPFFEKAGMTLGGKQKFTRNQEKLIRFIQSKNMNVGLLQDHTIRKGFLNKLSSEELTVFINILKALIKGRIGSSPSDAKRLMKDLEEGKLEKVISKVLPAERVYLYWLNPHWQAQTHRPTQSAQDSKNHTVESTFSEIPEGS